MITIIEVVKLSYRGLSKKTKKHILCPDCNVTIYWQSHIQRCPWCRKKVIDVALIMRDENARIAYHLRGEY